MGAAGAIETAATALSISESTLIGTLNLDTIGVDANIKIIRENITWQVRQNQRKIAVKNSFGFGGAFVSLILAEYI